MTSVTGREIFSKTGEISNYAVIWQNCSEELRVLGKHMPHSKRPQMRCEHTVVARRSGNSQKYGG
jgi:hypothetical protein